MGFSSFDFTPSIAITTSTKLLNVAGITYYQPPPIASQPNGYQGITPYQPLLPDPQKMSPQGFTTTSIAMANNSNPPPCSLMQPTPVMTTAHFPQLGRSAFMSATGVGGASGQSPLPATISSGASYPKGKERFSGSFPWALSGRILFAPPDTRAIFLHNGLLCNDTCSVTGEEGGA